ncbi:MAG: HD domain-containing phosphohydrolase [Planctomycetota bacterium]|jgi:HD-GYP domain-containing protein (c-di-GMP phosphodiesterase class II)
MAEDLSRIPIAAVRAHAQFDHSNFDVYLPNNTGSGPVLYHKSELGVAELDLDRIEASGLQYLFIRTEDVHHCEEALEQRLSDILASPKIDSGSKAVIAHSAGSSVAKNLLRDPTSNESIGRTVRVVDSIMNSLLEQPVIAGHLLDMAGHERSTASHMLIVSSLAVSFGAEVFGKEEIELIKCLGAAGMLHDLGKLSIPESILKKAEPLTRDELLLLQQHPVESVRLVKDDPSVSSLTRQIILQHHERVDGKGYPLGLSAEEILTASQVLGIVDSFHAMIGRRTYRSSMKESEANRILMTQADKQFDSRLLRMWVNHCGQRLAAQAESGCSVRVGEPTVQDVNEIAVRDEHKPRAAVPSVLDRRPTRHVCGGEAMVRFIVVGTIAGGFESQNEFRAIVHDLSKSGICVYTANPMYRGEIVNIEIEVKGQRLWIQSKVAWSRHHETAVYQNGLQFLKKIEASECHDPVDFGAQEFLPENDEAATTSETQGEENKESEPANDPIAQLKAIKANRAKDRASQQTVVTMAMSGDTNVRTEALEVLVSMNTSMTRKAVSVMINDEHRDIREAAVVASGTLKIRQTIPDLQKLLQSDDLKVSLYAAESLALMDDKSGLRLAADILARKIPESRLAARVVGEIVGHKFGANRVGMKAASRYLEGKKLIHA